MSKCFAEENNILFIISSKWDSSAPALGKRNNPARPHKAPKPQKP